ncbi:MAG: hypothetical protein H6738_08500 [Alphaproteobacteria bacterium]|nr:hypothetical protein [Alphaproteobacteria bacterium]MCB9696800.1 hypothetical protein [Alphaproteobacteria bacterium]
MAKRDFENGVFGDTLRSDRESAESAGRPARGGGARGVFEEEGEGFDSLVSQEEKQERAMGPKATAGRIRLKRDTGH